MWETIMMGVRYTGLLILCLFIYAVMNEITFISYFKNKAKYFFMEGKNTQEVDNDKRKI